MLRKKLKVPKKAKGFLLNPGFLASMPKKARYLFKNIKKYIFNLPAKERLLAWPRLQVSYFPFHVLQGAAVFAFTFVVLFTATVWLMPKPEITDANMIKHAIVKQVSPAVASQKVKWAVLVKKSDIQNGQAYLQIPKDAKKNKNKIYFCSRGQSNCYG